MNFMLSELEVQFREKRMQSLGPSIYDVHSPHGGGVRLWWTHVDGQAPCARSQKN